MILFIKSECVCLFEGGMRPPRADKRMRLRNLPSLAVFADSPLPRLLNLFIGPLPVRHPQGQGCSTQIPPASTCAGEEAYRQQGEHLRPRSQYRRFQEKRSGLHLNIPPAPPLSSFLRLFLHLISGVHFGGKRRIGRVKHALLPQRKPLLYQTQRQNPPRLPAASSSSSDVRFDQTASVAASRPSSATHDEFIRVVETLSWAPNRFRVVKATCASRFIRGLGEYADFSFSFSGGPPPHPPEERTDGLFGGRGRAAGLNARSRCPTMLLFLHLEIR